MSCATTYQAELKACPASVRVKAHLLQDTDYTIVLTGKFGIKYAQDVTSDGYGYIDINFASFDAGLFTSFSGTWNLEIFNEAKQRVTFTVCGDLYSSYSITFYNGNGVNDAIIEGQCSIISDVTDVETGYFKKAFNFITDHYDIPVSEHLIATQIFSIELLAKVDNVWQNIEFTYTIANNNDISILSNYDGYDMIVIITGIE